MYNTDILLRMACSRKIRVHYFVADGVMFWPSVVIAIFNFPANTQSMLKLKIFIIE